MAETLERPTLGAEAVFAWAKERHSITLKRAAGLPKPWTEDPVLRAYRFCSVYRELDKVTTWLRENWREPHHDDPDLWFACVVARHHNDCEVLNDLGWPVPWQPARYRDWAHERKRAGQRLFSPAYMISTSGTAVEHKCWYLEERVFTPLWLRREGLRPKAGDTLNSYHMLLTALFGMASFLAAQTVADVKFAEPLLSAPDWWTFAASGPGSRRGLNRVLGRHKDAPWREEDWRLALGRLLSDITPMFEAAGMPRLSAQDLQNCLCETDKDLRVRLGEGRPKQKFQGV